VTPQWERVLSCRPEVRQQLRVEKLAQVLGRRHRSSCVRGWIEVEALAELVQLGVVMAPWEENPLRDKVVLESLFQSVQEVVMVLSHHRSTWIPDRAVRAPTSPLTRCSLSSPQTLEAELDLYAVLVPILLIVVVHSREDMLDLQGTFSRFRRREYARLEARLALRVVGYLVEEEGWNDCSMKPG